MKNLKKYILGFVLMLISIPSIGQQTITVGYGETFESIANKYEITISDLLAANPGKNVCYAGMKIIIPQPSKSPVGDNNVSSPVIIYADSLLLVAKKLSSQGLYKKAIKIYDNLIDMNVRTPYAYAGRGECNFGLKKYKKAKADLNHAINSGKLVEIEKDWCEDALEDVEKAILAKRERRNAAWSKVGLAFAATAVAATAYVAASQTKTQNQSFQNPVPNQNPNLSRSDAAIAQTTAWEQQWRANNTAQLNQMSHNFVIQSKIQAEENSRQYMENLAKTRELIQSQAQMQTEFAFNKLNKWEEEFEKNAGRKPTEDEIDNYCQFNIPELYEARMQTKGMIGNYQPMTIDDNIITDKDKYKGKLTPEQYINSYRKWEHIAEKHFNSLTVLGGKYEDKNGNIKGYTGDTKSWGVTGISMNLRDAQREMRDIRLEAANYGVNIPISKWETVSPKVGY